MTFSTCDLSDNNEGKIQIAESLFQNYGGISAFGGEIVTIKCHEDNSLVKDTVGEPGQGKVLVVDGGGSLRRSLLGDQLAAKAVANGWAGIIIFGAIRDVEIIAGLDMGVKALNVIPLKTEKRGIGDKNIPVNFAGVTFKPGEYVYADLNGIIVSKISLA
jgi:regulator of ribonuclease activity A